MQSRALIEFPFASAAVLDALRSAQEDDWDDEGDSAESDGLVDAQFFALDV